MDARDRGKPKQIIHREGERALDETVDHQPVLIGIDVGQTRMVTFVVQTGRGDDAVEMLQWRPAGGGRRKGGGVRGRRLMPSSKREGTP
jgi:hypothetical protein